MRGMPLQPEEYEQHRDLVEASKPRRKKRKAKKKKAYRSGRAKRLGKYTTKELREEIKRRGFVKWRAGFSPDAWDEEQRRRMAIRRVRASVCDHTKLPPKLRKSGKNAGKFVCPSCHREVPPPTPKPGEGLVI
jgi:hypothetical protein